MRKKIAVFFGGKSVEHEISIITAIQAMENIDRNKYDVLPIYVSKENKLYTNIDFLEIKAFHDLNKVTNQNNEIYLEKKGNKVLIKKTYNNVFKKNVLTEIDLFFLIVHGKNVEDGTLTGFLKMYDLPIVGPSVLAGAIGQDKAVMKDILEVNKIPQVKYLKFNDNQQYEIINEEIKKHLGYPVIIKPANLGSSVGIEVCKNEYELENKLNEVFNYDKKIVVEEYLENFREMNISLYGNYNDIKVSSIEEVKKNDEILSYDDKYLANGKKISGMENIKKEIPANISEELKNNIENIAKKSYEVLNCNSLIRIDFMIVDDKIYLNEINTIPGSLSYYLWENKNISYQDLINDLVDNAIEQYFDETKKTQSLNVNILNLTGKNK